MKKNPGRKERRALAIKMRREDGRRRARQNEIEQKKKARGVLDESKESAKRETGSC